ncbi:hypothetical protein CDAR_616381 [Caerostris darwini]|uniref:Uncharacterized protein n=1 Tax=Caerostris darwini TaxID=1538125 RepID=A0AAV4NDS2_9ARAC|nr:hypothetical protein CDAR_616381 [Caerostris darwini]
MMGGSNSLAYDEDQLTSQENSKISTNSSGCLASLAVLKETPLFCTATYRINVTPLQVSSLITHYNYAALTFGKNWNNDHIMLLMLFGALSQY